MPSWVRYLRDNPARGDIKQPGSTELPKGEPDPADQETIHDLVDQVFRDKLSEIEHMAVPMTKHQAIRPREDRGTRREILPFPDYTKDGNEELAESRKRPPDSKAYRDLAETLWDRNFPKFSFQRDSGSKEAWVDRLFYVWFDSPLHQILWRSSLRDLVKDGKAEPWSVHEDIFEETVHDVAYALTHEGHLARVACKLSGFVLESTPMEVTERIQLNEYSLEEFLALESGSLSPALPMWTAPAGSTRTMAEINLHVPSETYTYRSRSEVGTLATDAVDRLKWALYESTDIDVPPTEGTIYVRNRYAVWPTEVNRDDSGWGQSIQLESSETQEAGELLSQLEISLDDHEDIEQALWHFGRACVFEQPRDAFVESMIALESLLVHSNGSTGLRLRQNAVALLGDRLDGEEVWDQVSGLWDSRNRTVHGGLSRTEKKEYVTEDAVTALHVLSKCIRASTEVALDGDIGGDEGVSEALERIVRNRLSKED